MNYPAVTETIFAELSHCCKGHAGAVRLVTAVIICSATDAGNNPNETN